MSLDAAVNRRFGVRETAAALGVKPRELQTLVRKKLLPEPDLTAGKAWALAAYSEAQLGAARHAMSFRAPQIAEELRWLHLTGPEKVRREKPAYNPSPDTEEVEGPEPPEPQTPAEAPEPLNAP